MLDRQLVFDTVTSHLFIQGKKSKFKRLQTAGPVAGRYIDTCMYRSPQGLKCAIGCLIPDELYKPIIEGCTLLSNPAVKYLLDPKYGDPKYGDPTDGDPTDDKSDLKFLSVLQNIHDDGAKDKSFTQSIINPLSRCAQWFSLDTFVLINCVRMLPA